MNAQFEGGGWDQGPNLIGIYVGPAELLTVPLRGWEQVAEQAQYMQHPE